MSDDDILHAAQRRLERRRAAMTPRDSFHDLDCTWLRDREKPDPNCHECSPLTDEERERILTNVMREVSVMRKQREARGVLARLIQEIEAKEQGDA